MKKPLNLRLNAKAPEHPLIFAPGVEIQLNAGALPEQIQLAPFGRHPTRDKSAVQVFDADAADQVISWFDFWPRKIARLAQINAIKVWVGHPDFAPEQWPNRIELGSITELSADEHGLNGKVRWNAGALEHVTKHKFPSVAWDCDVNGDGTETPSLLWSVGMWHKPNIKTVQAVINACACEEDHDKEEETQTTEEEPMLKSIMAALVAAGVVKEGDDENTVVVAIGEMKQTLEWKRQHEIEKKSRADQIRTALNAEADIADEALPVQLIERFNAATADVATLNQKLADHEAWREARINAVVGKAIESGLITKAEEAETVTRLNADFDGAFAGLIAKRVQLNSASLNLGGAKAGIVEASERITRLNAWCDEHMATKGCDRQTAWEASKADPTMKAIHEAMAVADKARATGGGDA